MNFSLEKRIEVLAGAEGEGRSDVNRLIAIARTKLEEATLFIDKAERVYNENHQAMKEEMCQEPQDTAETQG